MDTLTTEAVPIWASAEQSAYDHPLTEWVPYGNLDSVRVTAEMRSRTGAIKFQGFVQFADDPYDPATWSAVSLLGTVVSANGVVAGTTFETVSSTKRYRRYGVKAVNDTGGGTDLNLCYAILRIDQRSG
jgi:hypothetical protein